MKHTIVFLAALFFGNSALADIPNAIPQQGRIVSNGQNFDGIGHFKFLLFGDEDADHSSGNELAIWSNTATAPVNMNEPSAAVSLFVTKGLYSVWLGDTDTTGMAALPTDFDPSDKQLYLRLWFDDGSNGFQQLGPDQKIGSVPYALLAVHANFATGAGTAQSVTAGSVRSVHVENESLLGIDIATSAVSTSEVLDGSLLLEDLDLQDVDNWYMPRNATTIVVDPAGTGSAFTTIGAAVASVTPTAASPVVIEVRAGTYSESVDLKSYLHLKGAGMEHCTVFPPSTGASDTKALKLNSLTGVRISGFTFNGQASGNADAGIETTLSSPHIHDCRFIDINSSLGTSSETGGIVSSNSKPVIYRCEFDTDSNGIVLMDDSNGLIHSCEFGEASVFDPSMTGIRSFGSDCRIIGNSFSDHSLGIVSDIRPGLTASKIVIVGNRFSEIGEAIQIEPLVTATITGNSFEGDRSSEKGILSSGVAMISGNTFCDLGSFAVVAAGPTTNMNGNHIENCGPFGGQASAIDGGAVTVSGNSFANNFSDFGPNAPNVGLARFDSIFLEADPGSGLLAGPRLGVGPVPFVPTVEFEVRGQSLFAGPADFSSTVTFSGMTGMDNGLDVTGMSVLNGDTEVTGELTVSDTAILQGGLQVSGIDSTGNATVNGVVSADSYAFTSTQTFVKRISASGFVTDNDGVQFDRGTGLIRPTGTTTRLDLFGDVQLPQDARVTNVEFFVLDNANPENFSSIQGFFRYQEPPAVGETNVSSTGTQSTTGMSSVMKSFGDSDGTINQAVIDNEDRQYSLFVRLDVSAVPSGTGLRFYGAKITYAMDFLLP